MSTSAAPKTAYLICATPRSGSWLLADALDQTGLAGHPQEYFMNHVAFDAGWGVPTRENLTDYLDHVREESTTDNGVCGVKIHWSQLRFLAGLVGSSIDDTGTAFAWLVHHLAPLQVIRLDRTDKIRQALSYHRAMCDQQWWRLVGDGTDESAFAGPDFAEVDRLERLLTRHARRWDEQLAAAQVPVRVLSYEHLGADLAGTVLDCLLDFGVGFEPAIEAARAVAPRLAKQSDERTDLWVHEYITWRRAARRPVRAART